MWSTEAELEGPRDTVDALVSWFRHGPADARVDELEIDERDPTSESGFRVSR